MAGTRLHSPESANCRGRKTELLMIIPLHSALLLEVSNMANVLPNPNTDSREAPGERQPANLTSSEVNRNYNSKKTKWALSGV